jgi:hypothetical protein
MYNEIMAATQHARREAKSPFRHDTERAFSDFASYNEEVCCPVFRLA